MRRFWTVVLLALLATSCMSATTPEPGEAASPSGSSPSSPENTTWWQRGSSSTRPSVSIDVTPTAVAGVLGGSEATDPADVPTIVPTTVPTEIPESTATPEPTEVPEPTATPEPTAIPEPTATPGPTAIPEPIATPTTNTDSDESPEPEPGDDDLPPSDYDGEVRAIRSSQGLMMAVRAEVDGGFQVVTPCYNLAEVSSGLSISGPLDVLIDPGHGGEEPGAVGPNGLVEADVNFAVSELLRTELIARGYTAELTRYSDIRVAIQSRAELANALSPRVFMSIHHNGGYPESVPVAGTEVFVQLNDPESTRLGGLVFEELQAAFADIDIDWMGNPETLGVAWRQNDRGTDLYGVLRRTTNLVSVLTEAMFITTEAEAELLSDPATLQTEAVALADALERWFQTDDAGSGFVDGVIFLGDLGNGGGTEGCVDPPLD